MSKLTQAGQDAGGFIGGLLNPVLGGQTETTVTTKPTASSSTTTIVIVVVIVAVLAVVAYLTFKNKK